MRTIIEKALENSFSYQQYLEHFKQLVSNKKSSGEQQSDELSNYTKLNQARVKRLTKTQTISDEVKDTLNQLSSKITFLVLTESWCGDAAQTIPVIHKVAEASDFIDLKLAYRDENMELMNQFLTNGNQAIPKLIILDSNQQVLSDWGPRPKTATQMVNNYKTEHGALDATFKEMLQNWYNKDKGIDTLDDLNKLLTNIIRAINTSS